MPPDFEKYRLDELESSLAGIDREKYPENYAKLLEIIERRRREAPPEVRNNAPPAGFLATLHGDGSIEIQYSESFKVDAIAFHAIFLFVWTLVGITVLFQLGFTWTLLLWMAVWALGEFQVGRQFLSMVFGRVRLHLTGSEIQVTKYFHKWEKTYSIRKDWIKRVWQLKDRQGDSDSEPGWGLRVTALKDHPILESQEYEKSEWLGGVSAKWAGVEFAKAAKPEG